MDEKDQKELQALRVFVDGLKAQYTKAKTVFEKLDDLQLQYQKAVDIANSVVTEGEEFSSKLATTAQQAQTAFDEVEKIKVSIADHLSSANSSITTLQQINTQAAELSGAVKGQKESIDSQLALAKSSVEQITKHKTNAEQSLEKVNAVLLDFQGKADQMKTAYAEFLDIKKKIDDKNTGLQAAFDLVQKANQDANSLISDIEKLKVGATKTEAEIKEMHQSSTSTLDLIKQTAGEIEEKKSQIEEVAGITIDGAFANKFETRKNELNQSLNENNFSWKRILFMSVIALVVAVFLPFTNVVNDAFSFNTLSGVDGFLLRFFYTSPLVFLVAFSAIQYSRERTFLEKYAFKAASAAAIRNHTEFLIEKFEPKDVVDFTVEVFSSIYKEPFEEGFKKEKKSDVGTENKSISENLNLLANIDKLKTLVPDEVILKQVLDLLSKQK